MSLSSNRLMKLREPKIKGMVTPKNMLAVIALIVIVSIPFGFLGGNGKFNISIWFIALGFMSFASIGLLIVPLLPGMLVRLKEDMIVRGARGTNSQRVAYQDIDCIYFYRDCSYSRNENGEYSVINVQQKTVEGPNFTSFVVIMKNAKEVDDESELLNNSPRFLENFAVPDNVNVEQVVQILRDKGVKVVEGPLPS
jgi:hypothetical protein